MWRSPSKDMLQLMHVVLDELILPLDKVVLVMVVKFFGHQIIRFKDDFNVVFCLGHSANFCQKHTFWCQ